MTDSNYTAIAVLMDRSGSMESIRVEAENSINAFVKDQREVEGRATLRLSQFDNVYETVYPSTDINDVQDYTLVPRSMTALNDGIGRLVTEFGEELAAMPEDQRPGKVLVAIVTDGMENASREWTASKVRELIERQQNEYSWEFVFLAAGQDAVLTGAGYGISKGNTLTFTAGNIASANSSLSNYTTTYRSKGKAEFTDEDRESAVK